MKYLIWILVTGCSKFSMPETKVEHETYLRDKVEVVDIGNDRCYLTHVYGGISISCVRR